MKYVHRNYEVLYNGGPRSFDLLELLLQSASVLNKTLQ